MQADIISLLDKINDAIIVLDKDGNIGYVNETFAQVLGLEKSQMIAKNIWILRPRLVGTIVYLSTIEALERKEVKIIEWQSPYSDKFWESKIFPYLEGVVVVGRDITERKKVEEAFIKAKEQTDFDRQRLETILELTPVAVVILNAPDGKFSYANKRAKQLYGFDTLGLNLAENVAKVKAKRVDGTEYPIDEMPVSLSLKLLKTVLNQEMLIERPDGKAFPIIASTAPLCDKNGNVTAAIVIFEDISERKKAEEALRESEKLYHTLFDNSEDGFMLLEPIFDNTELAFDFRFIKLNAAYERQTGAKIGDVLGKLASEVTPALEPAITLLSGKVSKTGKSFHNEAFNKYSGKWFDSYYFPYSEGRIGILFRDITERKKAEQSLKEKSDELNRILDSTRTIIFYKDKQGKLIQTNKAFADALKVSREDLLGKTVFDLYSLEIAQQMTNDDLVVMESKKPKIGTIEQYESPTGLRWIKTDKIPSFDEKGEVNGIIGFSEEITERKKAEEALRKSEERFRSTMDNMIEGCQIIGFDWRYIYINRAAEQQNHRPKEELLGKRYMDMWPGVESNKVFAIIKKCMEERTPQTIENFLGTFPTGQTWFDLRFEPITEGVFILSVDITERKNLRKQMQDRERLATIGQVAGMVGHDIRNPLQTIGSELYLAKQTIDEVPVGRVKDDVMESINSIQEQTDYINKIVADLQDFAKPLKPELVEVNLCQLISEALKTIDVPESIDATELCKDSSLKLKLDPTFMRRILTNLVNNAIQAMPNGGKLIVREFTKADNVMITVEDTGVGIPDEVKAKLFTPLFTTKTKGQGFGLVAIKRMTEALGGKISFESEVGKGTKFKVELPLKS